METGWIQTWSGKKFSFENATPEMIDILDIGHALSNTCRFAGHVKSFYSVAQHSVLVSNYVHPALALMGLLHDSSEAFLNDIPSPIKHSDIFAGYREMENKLQTMIYQKFGINSPEHPLVKQVDLQMLATEKRDLLGKEPEDWGLKYEPFIEKIEPWSPTEAKHEFLKRFYQLYIE